MSDFLFSEAIEEDGSLVDEIETVSDNDFIDDTESDESVEDHYAFTNVNRNADAVYDSFSDFDFDQKPNNYCNEVCNLPVDEFKDYKQKIDLFIGTLINPQGSNNKDSVFYSILYTVRYFLTQKIETCRNEDDLRILLLKYSMRFIRLKKT